MLEIAEVETAPRDGSWAVVLVHSFVDRRLWLHTSGYCWVHPYTRELKHVGGHHPEEAPRLRMGMRLVLDTDERFVRPPSDPRKHRYKKAYRWTLESLLDSVYPFTNDVGFYYHCYQIGSHSEGRVKKVMIHHKDLNSHGPTNGWYEYHFGDGYVRYIADGGYITYA